MRIALIVAMTQNRVIGAGGGMPWHVSSDLIHFKKVTMGKPIVMGGKTHRSIGKALPGRDNIVITRSADNLPDGVMPARDLAHALEQAVECAKARDVDEVMIIGGGEIYAQAMDQADVIYLTEVHESVNGDVFFPTLDPLVWMEEAREDHSAGPKDSADYSFVTYQRKA